MRSPPQLPGRTDGDDERIVFVQNLSFKCDCGR